MTRALPTDRLTLEQVRTHPWMQGDIASVEEIAQSFANLMPAKKLKDDYQNRQEARKSWNVELKKLRETTKWADSPDKTLVEELKGLTYKPFHAQVAQYSSFSGFYSDCIGSNLFIALIEYLNEKKVDFVMDKYNWKISFTVEERDEIEDSDGEETLL